MTDPSDIQELLDKEPFEPFRVFMSDGHAYDIVNPELTVPMDTKLFVALPKDRWKFLSYQQMTRIESSDVAA